MGVSLELDYSRTVKATMVLRGIGGGMAGVTPQQCLTGTSMVDTFDAKANQLVWRGVAQGTLNGKDSQKNIRLLDKAIANILKKYPS